MKDITEIDVDFAKLDEDPPDKKTWWKLYRHVAPFLMLQARRLGVQESDISDLVQETFLKFLTKISEVKSIIEKESVQDVPAIVYRYLLNMIKYSAYNWRRSEKRYQALIKRFEEEHSAVINSEPTESLSYRDRFVLNVLRKYLSQSEKRIIYWRCYTDMPLPFRSISKKLGISDVAARKRYSRAIKSARTAILREARKMLAMGRGDKLSLEEIIAELE